MLINCNNSNKIYCDNCYVTITSYHNSKYYISYQDQSLQLYLQVKNKQIFVDECIEYTFGCSTITWKDSSCY